MNEPCGDGFLRKFFAPVIEAFKKIGSDGFSGFDLDGMKSIWSRLDEDVNFMTLLVAEKMNKGPRLQMLECRDLRASGKEDLEPANAREWFYRTVAVR